MYDCFIDGSKFTHSNQYVALAGTFSTLREMFEAQLGVYLEITAATSDHYYGFYYTLLYYLF